MTYLYPTDLCRLVEYAFSNSMRFFISCIKSQILTQRLRKCVCKFEYEQVFNYKL